MTFTILQVMSDQEMQKYPKCCIRILCALWLELTDEIFIYSLKYTYTFHKTLTTCINHDISDQETQKYQKYVPQFHLHCG